MSLEENQDFLKISFSKIILKFTTLLISSLLALNGWFINRLVYSIDLNIQNVQEHSIKLASLDEKITGLKTSLDRISKNRDKRSSLREINLKK